MNFIEQEDSENVKKYFISGITLLYYQAMGSG